MAAVLKSTAREKAREAWGDPLPDWIEALARACDATSQNQAAQKLERSAALVSQVLGRKYPGDLALIEDLVRGVFLKETETCPVLGEIGRQTCRKWRARAARFQNVNSQYVTMFRACNACPVHLETPTTDSDEDTPDDPSRKTQT